MDKKLQNLPPFRKKMQVFPLTCVYHKRDVYAPTSCYRFHFHCYQRVVVALKETIRLMENVDKSVVE